MSQGPIDRSGEEARHATISGVAVVTIPLDHYADLLRCRRLVAENNLRRGSKPQRRKPSPSRLHLDAPEVAALVREKLIAGFSIEATERAARSVFGENAPNWSAIQRYRLKLIADGDPIPRQPVSIAGNAVTSP